MALDPVVLNKLERYCSYSERCSYDVEQKLFKLKVPRELFPAYLKWLREGTFVDDERFMFHYIRSHFQNKKWGRQKIKSALAAKKLKPTEILFERAGMLPEDESEMILQLAKKKWALLKNETPLKRKEKVIRYLLTKGFATGPVMSVMKAAAEF